MKKGRGYAGFSTEPARKPYEQEMRQALALHQNGKLAEAASLYRNVLTRIPNHFEALHLLGLIAYQTSDFHRANDLMRKAIRVKADFPVVHSDRGVVLHFLGRFDEAIASYDRAIALKPDYAVAYSYRGNTLQEMRRLEEALASYDLAIAIKPDYAEAYSNRGRTLNELRRFGEALASCDRAIALKRDFAEAYSNRGNSLQEMKRSEEALISYDRAIALRPDFAEAYCNRVRTLTELKRFGEALASCDRAIALRPDFAEAYSNRGNTLQEMKRLEEALASCDRAIALKPDFAEAHSNRGRTLNELKRFGEALASCDRAIALKPDFAEAYSNRGNTLQEMNRLEEALASCDRAIALEPDFAEAYSNRGRTVNELRRFSEALASCDRAIALKPDFAEAYSNRGNTLQEMKRIEEALASYDRAIALKPDLAEAYWNKSLALLLTGEFETGWSLYEWRWKTEAFAPSKRSFPGQLWLGTEPLEGKTILLHPEQGYGDTIQFCRYARLVSALGARVIMEVPQALAGLFGRLEGVDQLIKAGEALPSFQYHCSLLSLPLALKTELAHMPSPAPYLTSDPDKRLTWMRRIGPTARLRVGIVWSGSTTHKNDHNRSVKLQEFLSHLPDDCDYVSLQKELREGDEEVLAENAIKHYGSELLDFSDTAALCELMDVVVSVDTSVAHLAGALGKPTWVLLPFIPDWRWLLDRGDSPWYQSVKLYRQGEDRNWEPVLRRVAGDLSKLANANRAG